MSKPPIFKFAIREDLDNCKSLFLPTKATPLSTGWDVRAAFYDRKCVVISPGDFIKIPLGFRAFCPEGWWYELKPRSSSFAKKHMHCLYGTIDEDYEDELILAAQFIPPSIIQDRLIINFADAVGQIIPVKRKNMLVERISNDEYDRLCKQRNATRGTGGFGSTTK